MNSDLCSDNRITFLVHLLGLQTLRQHTAAAECYWHEGFFPRAFELRCSCIKLSAVWLFALRRTLRSPAGAREGKGRATKAVGDEVKFCFGMQCHLASEALSAFFGGEKAYL